MSETATNATPERAPATHEVIEGLRDSVEGLREATLTEDRVREIVEGAASERGYTPADSNVAVTGEREQYGWQGERSWFADLVEAKMGGSTQARERIARQTELATRDLSSTDGAGGEFVAPVYMQDEFIELARASRPTADAVMSAPLPPDTDSINIPRLATGTTVAAQADLGTVAETDATTDLVNVPVITVAGQQDMSRQVFDRSAPGIDRIILADLAAAYGTGVDTQVLNGSGAGANAEGILQADGVNTTAYTDASPTVPELWPKIAEAISEVHTNRLLPPTAIAMHPRRWAWITAALDSTNRPLVAPSGNSVNAVAAFERVASENVVGEMQGLPVIIDANIPTNLGAGTNEDRIIILRTNDSWLFEENRNPRQNTYFEVLSGVLGVRVQVYGYLAFTAERFPASISIISGTGLATPSF